MNLPFDGAISRYFRNDAPEDIRRAIEKADKDDVLSRGYPYREKLRKQDYEDHLAALQIQLVRMQNDLRATGKRLVVVFEGRDGAGKGGTIGVVCQNLNPRFATVVALPKPTEREAAQWYFQRYADWLPASGEIVLFDRSWYNRGIVEPVFGFCTPGQREHFFRQQPYFEGVLVDEGIVFLKFWFSVGRAEQLKRMLDRESDPLKQWKLSRIDVDGLQKWDAYTSAIHETLGRTHSPRTPWTVIRSDDKPRARIAAIQSILLALDYQGKDDKIIGKPDPLICGGLDMLDV